MIWLSSKAGKDNASDNTSKKQEGKRCEGERILLQATR